MNQVVIATAGHVDHGKTTLIKRLTGVDTDTTAEEKKRGLTINLGFTFFELPNHRRVGIVDVPGHEKFLKNMLAGLAGIDVVLLVVDVNEGVMPQTIEHAQILMLLGVTKFITVLTKVDTVDDELIELAAADVKETFAGTVIANAPVIKTDAVSGTGISNLIDEIQRVSATVAPHADFDAPRLNVDRIFSLKGLGAVVTGTLLEGQISVGASLMAYPAALPVHVKNIQVYDGDAKLASPGQRTALNININSKDIERGNVIAKQQTVEVSSELNLDLQTLDVADGELELNTRVRMYVGAQEVLGRIYPLGTDKISANQHYLIQIRLEEPVIVKYGDKFIIRTYSPMKTVGGGKILDVHPASRRRYAETTLSTLNVRRDGSLTDIISDFCNNTEAVTIEVPTLQIMFNCSISAVKDALNQLIERELVIEFHGHFLITGRLQSQTTWLTQELQVFHDQYPLRPGIRQAELKAKLAQQIGKQAGQQVLDYMIENRIVKLTGDALSLVDFDPQMTSDQKKIREQLLSRVRQAGLTPPTIDQLTNGDAATTEVLTAMIGESVVSLDEVTVMDQGSYRTAIDHVVAFIRQHGELSLADYRDITGTSRRYAMLVLGRMDHDGITVRKENKRILKKVAN